MPQKNRVLIIGIDGATFNIINPLISENKLPTFQRLINQGTHGILNSVVPPLSATGWTSLVTGKNPGKHDIFGFYDKYNGSYNPHVINSKNLKANTIWKIIEEYGLRSILVNIPVTYPPEPVNGILISGMLTPQGECFTYPEKLSQELHQKNYVVDIFHHYRDSLDKYMELAFEVVTTRQQVLKEQLTRNDWDFAMAVFTTPDRLQHTIWQHQSAIQEIYIKMDQLIGKLLDELDEFTHVMVVSDHGFKSVTKKFFVNEWLWELGLLSKEISTQKPSIPDFWQEQFGHQNNDRLLSQFLAKTGITKDNIRSLLPNPICELIKKATPLSLRKVFPKENLIIHWDKTKAYFSPHFSQGININLKGREPNGVVKPGHDYEQLRELIIHELLRLRDPHTFENIVDEVFRGEDVFQGDFIDHAPDIVFIPRNYDYVLEANKRTSSKCIGSSYDDYPVFSGHDSKGIIVVQGPSVKKGAVIQHSKIYDIAPTILKILDVPIPDDMDGNVLFPLFENEKPIPYIIENRFPVNEYNYSYDGYAVV